MQAIAFPPLAAPFPEVDAASLIVQYLEALGVRYVFGVPGGAIEPLYNALAVSSRRGGPRPVLARHEAGAAFMAEGYARETGFLGACCATSGPGATNLLTGVACAFEGGVPLLAITGQPALPLFGKRALQESACTGVNSVEMFRACTHYSSLVSHVEQLESKLGRALMRALHGTRGPVHLSVPVDVLRTPVTPRGEGPLQLARLLRREPWLDEAAVQRLSGMLRGSERTVMVVGGGCGEAVPAIMELASRLGASFVSTPDAKGLIQPSHPLYRGVFGFAGHASAQLVLREGADTILLIGAPVSEWTTAAWSEHLLNGRLVHVCENEEQLTGSTMAALHVRGQLRKVFERLLELVPEVPRPDAPTTGVFRCPVVPARTQETTDAEITSRAHSPVKPQDLMAELSRRFPCNTRFVADAGNSAAWAIHHLVPRDRRAAGSGSAQGPDRRRNHAGWLRVLAEFAPMGWAIGASVGMARGNPEGPVLCITGDGSYLMSGQEITVALQEQLRVVFVVLNDSALGMVKHGQRLARAEQVAYELPVIDYALLARALGVEGHVIRSLADFDALDLDAITRRDGPTLLDVRIDGEEVPPMSLRMGTLGTGR